MIAAIRIKGKVDVPKDIEETLYRLRLRRKYACVIFNEEKFKPILKKVRDYVAYGAINEETLKELIKKRAKPLQNKKVNVEKIIENLKNGKKLSETGIKPFFRLHPPRGGIKSKEHYPKGVLGENKKINELILRML